MPSYFITWTTYGTWLHGDRRESVSMRANAIETPRLAADVELERRRALSMVEKPLVLSTHQRSLVDGVIRSHFEIRGWRLHALNVRTNHVHVVCSAAAKPEKVMGELKAWGSRRLREQEPGLMKVWTRHGSTRWLESDASLARAIEYVTNEQ